MKEPVSPAANLQDLGVNLRIVAVHDEFLELDRENQPAKILLACRLTSLQHGGLLQGRIKDQREVAVSSGWIELRNRQQRLKTHPTEHGNFAFSGLTQGVYTLIWTHPPCPPYHQTVSLENELIRSVEFIVPSTCR